MKINREGTTQISYRLSVNISSLNISKFHSRLFSNNSMISWGPRKDFGWALVDATLIPLTLDNRAESADDLLESQGLREA